MIPDVPWMKPDFPVMFVCKTVVSEFDPWPYNSLLCLLEIMIGDVDVSFSCLHISCAYMYIVCFLARPSLENFGEG